MEHTYGITAGYGAPAGLHLYQEIIRQSLVLNGHTDLDFPRFIITNLPRAIMTETGIIQNETEFIRANTEANEAFTNATRVIALCNSFHRELKTLERIYGEERLINLPQWVAETVLSRGYRNPLLVSSQETIQSGLYLHHGFERLRDHYNPRLIDSGMKAGTPFDGYLYDIIEQAEKEDADCIIMGCTDLNLYAKRARELTALPVIDSVEEAAAIIVQGQ